jgi:hypothetical protein
VWRDARGPDADVYAARIDASGARPWTADGVAVYAGAGDQTVPFLVEDGAGGAIVVWQDTRGGGNDVYAQRIDATGAPVWAVGGVAISAAAFSQSAPRIATDGSGGAVIVWQHSSDVWAQRIDASGAEVWTPGGVEIAAATNAQSSPRVVADGAGGAFIAWADDRDELYTEDLYAQHVDAAGAASWDESGDLVCVSMADAMFELCAAGAGEAALVWKTDDGYLHETRLKASGVTGIGETPSASRLAMLPNVPNPFTGTTEFRIQVDRPGVITAEVFDVTGRRVARYTMAAASAGWHAMVVSDRDAGGRMLPSGIYLCRVRSGFATVTGKMVIAR